jgi:hypothetical protein
MNAHALTYPSLQRRLISQRRSRAFFSARTTQHLRSRARTRRRVMVEVARATVALGAVAAWSALVILLAA